MEFTTDMTFKTAKPILERIKREKNGLLLCCVMLHKTNNIKQMFMISGVMKISTSGYFQWTGFIADNICFKSTLGNNP